MKLSDVVQIAAPPKHFHTVESLAAAHPRFDFRAEVNPLGRLISNKYFLGIEIEAEGYRGVDSADKMSIYHSILWHSKPDGSLRNNGIEFITSPINGDVVPYCLGVLDYVNKKYKLQYNDLTGNHVHLNAMDMTMKQIAMFAAHNVIFEPALFRFSGNRNKSIYCVPIRNSENDYPTLINSSEAKKLYRAVANGNKYIALNYRTLRQYGTFEFRHMEGTADMGRIINWINLILRLREAAEMPFKETLARIYALNTNSQYEELAYDVFKEQLPLIQAPTLAREMAEGVALLKEWEVCVDQDCDTLVQDVPTKIMAKRRAIQRDAWANPWFNVAAEKRRQEELLRLANGFQRQPAPPQPEMVFNVNNQAVVQELARINALDFNAIDLIDNNGEQ